MAEHHFQQDKEIADFETLTLQQPHDNEGEVVCTVLRLKKEKRHPIAALHVHGFNDYCFHQETAQRFDEKGVDWYGIDLRRSGRSYRLHQKFNGLNAMEEYFEDLHAALKVIKDEGATYILLMGHSLGGLVVSLFAAENSGKALYDAVFLNSPFYEQNKDIVTKKLLIPLVSMLAKIFPKLPVPGGFSKFYGPSLHVNDKG
ncbi:MAG: alpha/beta hydrolase [Bacteroidales bacterium]|nr:alpha/beta hydrolase [Bacteroidales bacterium]